MGEVVIRALSVSHQFKAQPLSRFFYMWEELLYGNMHLKQILQLSNGFLKFLILFIKQNQ